MSALRIELVDTDRAMVDAWRFAFATLGDEDAGRVRVVHGSILDRAVDAWVSPTNALGSMDGGLDGAIRGYFGPEIERRLQALIRRDHGGSLAIGRAVLVPTGEPSPRFVVSTPTVVGSAEPVAEPLTVAIAMAAALVAVDRYNARCARAGEAPILSLALPGLGAATGGVPVARCAGLMSRAWRAYLAGQLDRDAGLREALRA